MYSEIEMFKEENKLAYEIVPRRGWSILGVNSQQRKRKSCNMLSEGSVVPEKPVGGLARVTPDSFQDHDVYRYGFAMSVPIRLPDIAESEDSYE